MSQHSEHRLQREFDAAQILKAALINGNIVGNDDTDTLADMIEGETGLHEAIGAVMTAIDEDEILVTGIDALLKSLQARKSASAARTDRRRAAIAKGMEAGLLKTLKLPQCTISLREMAPSLEIVAEDMIPRRYFVEQPAPAPKLDKAALKAALTAEVVDDIPGARMTNGGTSLTIRRA